MAFVKRTIKDRAIQYPKRYQLVEVSPGIFDLVPVTGTITEAGTPVNKDLLQRYEDALGEHDLAIPNKLDKNGDSKDNLVTFPTQSHAGNILSGEKHETLFSKIRFWMETFIAHGLDAVKHITAAERTTWNGKAPSKHASSATTYGAGTPTLHGHVKTINALTQASHVDGTALSAYQGKVLDDKIIAGDNKVCEFIGKFSGSEFTVTLTKEYKILKLFFISTSSNAYVKTYPPYTPRVDASANYFDNSLADGWLWSGYYRYSEILINSSGSIRNILINSIASGSASQSAIARQGLVVGNTSNPNTIYCKSNNSVAFDLYLYGII